MLGAGLQFNRSRNGEGRFYSAARARVIQDSLRRAKSDVTSSRLRSSSVDASADKCKPDEASVTIAPASDTIAPASETQSVCNLERFLESVTPSVPLQHLPKMAMKNWKMRDMESHSYFMLSDLWDSIKEWSAYGVGVPLILNDRDGVVQYYVPYLSAIQCYTDPSRQREQLRRMGDESDGDFRDSSSDGSSDSDMEGAGLNRGEHRGFHEGFSSDEGEHGSSQGCPSFGYVERDPPYCREPLANKITDLAKYFPELTTLRSCDLLPSSWISVAWYPIYRIPTGPTLRDLDACFLTYHSLHTPTAGGKAADLTQSSGNPRTPLPVFGLASYKYKSALWTPSSGHKHDLEINLFQSAYNWLNQLQFHHPDFTFFSRG